MSPRTEKQFEEIRRVNEKIILEAALSLFAEKGYNSTSMDSIAKQAKVSKGNLYNYFKNKEALLESVLQNGINQFSELYTDNQNELESEDDFEQFVRANFEILKVNKSFWKLYYSLVTQTKVQHLFQKIFSPFLEQYMKVFEAYFYKKGDENPTATAMLLGSIIDGVSLCFIVMEEIYPLEDVQKKIIEKFK
jgi:AcrR family transcriptional regulator